MTNTVLLAALLLASPFQPMEQQPVQEQVEVRLSQENAAMLRCSAAFALVSYGQANGDEASMQWPAIDPRGREFFVRALAKVMDDTEMNRDQVTELVEAEAQRLIDENTLESVMPGCLLMLEASGI